jgi:hypothetical protein
MKRFSAIFNKHSLLHVGNTSPENRRHAFEPEIELRFSKHQLAGMTGFPWLARWCAVLAALAFAFVAVPASAAVELTFYSKELGASFPHAFVTMHGSLDRSGQKVDGDFGFSAKTVSPAILFGPVTGEVILDHGAAYIRGSDKHFSVLLDDPDYDRVAAAIETWRKLTQPSYDLNKRNCVHFVADIARTLGMTVDTTRLMKKPRSFLEAMTAANGPWLLAHNAHLYRDEAAAGTAPKAPRP